MDAVVFDSVTKRYRDASVRYLFRPRISQGVENLSFSVAGGETFGLLGLNGAGKTTAFKLIMGLLRPDEGRVLVSGVSPSDSSVLRDIGYLPEISYFHKNLTVRETLQFLSALSGVKVGETGIKETLSMVGLGDFASRKVGKLSKGMQQRLSMAQSLIHNPGILIYDEPTSGLDPLGIREMRGLLESLKKSGKTIILSSHITSEVEKLCDRVGIIKSGRLIKIASAAEFSRPGELENIFVGAVS
ncbi:MAG: ABC transporter ATP-binding protein [Elusimicrobia bacterium HGW-Elusimicrobia-1]|jgi:ABC-type multidrug transport system ATPase subunit|nr:MAG: ABC transporter ATP-binding protein [Elusimicrobia bacterium HGW-Elusimicrobia-1]